MNERELIIMLESALKVARYELITLHPRLTDQYQRPVKIAIEMANVAIAEADKYFETKEKTK